MARKGVDFSGLRPSAQQLLDAGIECVLFYVGPPGDWRMPPRALIDSYIAAGIECAAIYEEGDGSFARQGYQRGVQVGQNARRCLDGYGWGGPAFVATDVDITPAQVMTGVEAYRGVGDGAGREMGIYGGGLIVEAVRNYLGWRLLWRANASSWHHGAAPTGILVQQHVEAAPGVPNTDLNTIYVDKGGYWGQWSPGLVTPTNPNPEEDDMSVQQLYDDAKGGPNGTIDDLVARIAGKVGQAMSGDARVEGQSWAPSKDLGTVESALTSVVLDQLDPRRGTPGPNPNAKPIRDFVERIPE